MVYRQLWWHCGWNGHINHRKPNFDNDILRPLGNHKLWELELCDNNGDGELRAFGYQQPE